MGDERNSSSVVGGAVAIAVVMAMLLCGGGALLFGGVMFFWSTTETLPPQSAGQAIPVPAVIAHSNVVSVEGDGTLLWNGEPVLKAELTRRLDALQNSDVPPGSISVRAEKQVPFGSLEEVFQLLNDRDLTWRLEQAR